MLTHSWPLRCRLESTASIEGPRASAPHPTTYKIVSFPLKFEEPVKPTMLTSEEALRLVCRIWLFTDEGVEAAGASLAG